MTIISIYIAPQASNIEIKNTIAQIIHNTKDMEKVLIVGDLNAHHRYWGDDKTDKKMKSSWKNLKIQN